MADLINTLGWLGLWLVTMVTEQHWQSLDDFLLANGWHYEGRGVWYK